MKNNTKTLASQMEKAGFSIKEINSAITFSERIAYNNETPEEDETDNVLTVLDVRSRDIDLEDGNSFLKESVITLCDKKGRVFEIEVDVEESWKICNHWSEDECTKREESFYLLTQ